MTESSVTLTTGAKEALQRLAGGDRLAREKNRSVVRWNDGTPLHHKSFAKLNDAKVLKTVKGEDGFDTWEINAVGKKLADKLAKAA